MPYYLRLWSSRDEPLSLATVTEVAPSGIQIELEAGEPDNWTAILLSSPSGEPICLLEKSDDKVRGDEIEEFVDEMKDALPSSGARWVATYLRSSKSLISCQLLAAGFEGKFSTLPIEVLWRLKSQLRDGILQADHEGFSNPNGFHIVWQFSEHVEGLWNMAVLDEHGQWIGFEMDLGDPNHRAAFRSGKVPSGVAVVPG